MATTIAEVQTNFNTYIGDSSTDRVSAAERLQYFTEATSWLKETLENDHTVSTYDIDYFDTVHYYKISTAVADFFDTNDLRRKVGENYIPFTTKSSREIVTEIAQGRDYGSVTSTSLSGKVESAYAIERRDGSTFLIINHNSKYNKKQISSFESLTVDGGTWAVDATNSDATNLAVDTNDYQEGTASFSFDLDVSQSANNKGEIVNAGLTDLDLSDYKDLASWLLDVKLPEVTNITSYTLYWGSDTSNYYSVTVTTDLNGNAFVVGWQTLQFDWLGATQTGTPDDDAIDYIQIDLNYGAGQSDATSFKLDNLRLVRPEELKFYYTDWTVGKNNAGTDIYAFTATTDVPYFSGQYDQYKYIVAHKAAALCFHSLRLYTEADREEMEALRAVKRLGDIIPSSVTREQRSFKVRGISFNRGNRKRFNIR